MKTENEKGQAAIERLATFIPLENIQLYLKLYRALQKTKFRGLKEFPVKEISAIEKNLFRLYESEWIDIENLLNMYDSLFISIFWSKDGENFQESTAASEMKKVGSPSNYAFNFLIFAIIYDMKNFTQKPHYGEVVNFLEECEIINRVSDVKFTEEDLRKRFKRLRFIEIAKSLFYASRIAGNEDNIQLRKITTEYFTHKKYAGFIHKIFSKIDEIISKRKIPNLSLRDNSLQDAILESLSRIILFKD
jgi:hypothetical protein